MKSNVFMLTPPEPEPSRTEAERLLAEIVPTLDSLERMVARMRQHQATWARQLAKERGVAFIRPEHLRIEFAAKESER